MNRPLPLQGLLPEPAARSGIALAGKGFRPFFLGASAFAVFIVPLWLMVLGGVIRPGRYLEPVAWHAHEMVFGYAVAVIAGFLLTAVGNWTQRETSTGLPLLALAGLWVLGRIAMALPGLLPRGLVAAIDIAFLPVLGIVLARPLIAAGNRRNFVMLGVLAVLTAANVTVHLEALGVFAAGAARHAGLVAIDVIVFLMLVIAGRVIPMFTRNATSATNIVSSRWLERATMVSALALVAIDIVMPESKAAMAASCVLGVATLARAVRWGSSRTFRNPLLLVLHAGYAWIPIGLVLRASSIAGALHALTVGAIGGLTLGMMARVSLGHTGRPLVAAPPTIVAFVAISGAALVRVFGPLVTQRYLDLLVCAGALWALAFVLYLAAHARALFSRRPDGRAG